jgi:hypothetical protein
MVGTSTAMLRLRGSGDHLRLRVAKAPDPIANVRECCRASVAVEKALGEAIRDALAAGHNWAEVGHVLGVEASTSVGVAEQYDASRSWMRSRFWGKGDETTRRSAHLSHWPRSTRSSQPSVISWGAWEQSTAVAPATAGASVQSSAFSAGLSPGDTAVRHTLTEGLSISAAWPGSILLTHRHRHVPVIYPRHGRMARS